MKEKQIELGLVYLLKAYKLYTELGDKDGLVHSSGGVGNLYEAKKDFKNALKYYYEMLRVAKELDFKEGIRDAYDNFASVYYQNGQCDKALEYTQLFNNMKDSILNKENLKQAAELITRYETEKKEKEILLLKKNQYLNAQIIKQQQYEQWALIIGVALLLISIARIYSRYKFKQKANITLEKQKEEIQLTVNKLTIIQDELCKVMEQKEKLTSIIAHDLRTPLRFITMISEHLKNNIATLSLQEQKELTTNLSTSSKLTFALADELLIWLNVQKHQFKVIFSKVNILELLNELELFFSDIAKAQNTQIKIKLRDSLYFETDERLLKIILRNVIDNAIKNTINGKITIDASTVNEKKMLEIRIEDNGKGMTKQQIESLGLENEFGFSFEIKDKLGFQIIKDLTYLIKGKIEMKSKIGKGTSVTLTFH